MSTNAPVSAGGVATFQVQAVLSGGDPEVLASFDKSTFVRTNLYKEDFNYDFTSQRVFNSGIFNRYFTEITFSRSRHWDDTNGGSASSSLYIYNWAQQFDSRTLVGPCQATWDWPPLNTNESCDNYEIESDDTTGVGTWELREAATDVPKEHRKYSINVPSYEINPSRNLWSGQYTCSDTSQTRLELVVGGRALPGQPRTVTLKVTALTASNPSGWDPLDYFSSGDPLGSEPFPGPDDQAVAPENIQVNGVTCIDADGVNGFVTLTVPPGTTNLDVTPVVATPTDTYSFDVEPVALQIMANGIPLDPIATNAEFCVGQYVSFTGSFDSPISNLVSSTAAKWVFAGNYVNTNSGGSSSSSTNYFAEPDLLTNAVTSAWWVSGGTNPPANYTAELAENVTLSNGTQIIFKAKGVFNMFKPFAVMDNPTNHGIPENMWWVPWNAFHFGRIGLGVTNSGPNNMSFLTRIISSDFRGNAKITQLCTINATDIPDVHVTNELDNTDPYTNSTVRVNKNPNPVPPINQIFLEDAPQDSYFGSFSDSSSFVDYIMFTPGNNGDIYVPIGKITWSTSFGASYPSTNIAPNIVIGPVGPDNSQDWPIWTSVYSNPQ
jgi:hypothetical protein